MLILDFINVGNGDSILIRETEGARTVFSLLVDCGHDALIRDDHPQELDPRSRRIFAGDFLRKQGVSHLDMLLLTHFHRDHIGGLSRVLEAASVGKLVCTYVPPADGCAPEPDLDSAFPHQARNLLRCLRIYSDALRDHPGRVRESVVLSGDRQERFASTDSLSMDVYCADSGLYASQKRVFDAAFRGERNGYDLTHFSRMMNVSSLRQRLSYHGREIVLGGDAYATLWEQDSTLPCDVLKLPHHGSLSSTTRKFLRRLSPKQIVVSVAGGRPDERPHPYIVSLLREFTQQVYFTDAVSIPGLVEAEFHESVHMEFP